MTDRDHVTATALRAIAVAQTHAHGTVTLEHVLAALMERPEVRKCLSDLKIDRDALETELNTFLDDIDRATALTAPPGRTREFDVVFARTLAYAQFAPKRFPNGIDILFQLMDFGETFACSILNKYGVTPSSLRGYLVQGRQPHNEAHGENEPTNKTEAVSFIRKYCVNLNELATTGRIDPVIGRLSEIHRITQIIARRTKNNAALVGESGVGKTAIIEGLAWKITQGEVPNVFKQSVIWSLDVASLVAGTRFRGDFEERMKFLLKAFAMIEEDEPILFIDEFHTIMDAGSGSKGALDVSNILKPALARGKLRCIGSTTEKDWRQHFSKDRALMRRFKKITIDEPSVEDAKLILRGIRPAYEQFHGVRYTDAALDASVILTRKYVAGKLPDMAIDVMDEAGARHRIADQPMTIINVEAIEKEISLITKIPEQHMREDEASGLQSLEDDLKAAIYGQDHAISTLVNAILIHRAGLSEANKPEGSYLFIGPTGVGKSELCRELALCLGRKLVKFDMSEYMEKHSVSKLIGAPPGYVGFGDGESGNGLLINQIDTHASCVLLLDEIEKAHPDILNILLQVMDDAILTSSDGRNVSFRNVILIMTSNVGVAMMEKQGIGFVPVMGEIDENLIKEAFSPEFRNRLDAIVSFGSLEKKNILRVVDKFVTQLLQSVADRGVSIEISDAAKDWLTEKGYDPIYGARPLKRLIAETIKQPLSRMMLFGELKHGGIVSITVSDTGLFISTLT